MTIGGIGAGTVEPLNYALSNLSDVSEAYGQSIQSGDLVTASAPVGYANATMAQVDISVAKMAQQTMEAGFAKLAESFQGMNTSYNAAAAGSSYACVGTNFDAYA